MEKAGKGGVLGGKASSGAAVLSPQLYRYLRLMSRLPSPVRRYCSCPRF